jgi:hypothetical protein
MGLQWIGGDKKLVLFNNLSRFNSCGFSTTNAVVGLDA